MLFNHLYPETNLCPISGEPISFDFTMPNFLRPHGFIYKIPSVNSKTIVIISDSAMTDPQKLMRLSARKEEFISKLSKCTEEEFHVS